MYTPLGMVGLDAVQEVLIDAEDRLRAIIQERLSAHAYNEVMAIARIAENLAVLRQDPLFSETLETLRARGISSSVSSDGTAADGGDAPSKSAGRRMPTYPHFKREGDRLVKVGWSKKERRAYEHKAPRAVVSIVAQTLASQPKSFSMEELLPISDEDGTAVPSHQVYVVIAWLRELGIVSRNGNDGYSVKQAELTEERIHERWNSIETQ